jgi:hypothetical protein
MSAGLEKLLDIRQETEKTAETDLAAALAARAKADQEQRRRDQMAADAETRFRAERGRLASAPLDRVGQAQGHLAFVARLEAERSHLADEARRHRKGPLAAAHAAEEEARRAHIEARREREAIEKHLAHKEADARVLEGRRAEEAADDLTRAAHLRRSR